MKNLCVDKFVELREFLISEKISFITLIHKVIISKQKVNIYNQKSLSYVHYFHYCRCQFDMDLNHIVELLVQYFVVVLP